VPAFNNKLKDAGLGSLITNLDVKSAPPDESMFRRRY